MDCQEFGEYYYGLEEEAVPERAREHLARCPACRQACLAQDALDRLAKELPREKATTPLWARIEESLRAEPRPRRTLRTLLGRALVAAAALLLVLLPFTAAPAGKPEMLLTDEEATRFDREQERADQMLRRLEPLLLARLPGWEDAGVLAGQIGYLDEGLSNCREAADSNPHNPAVRQSLLRTTHRKIKIIEDLLSR